MKPSIVIDLDVVTVGSWKKADERRSVAESFMRAAEAGLFYVITPYVLLELVEKWKDRALAGLIKGFYQKVTDEYVEKIEVIEELFDDFEDVYGALIEIGVKDEDAFLVMVCLVKKAVLVTFNRKHLKNKEADIADVLVKCGHEPIKIKAPEEIIAENGSLGLNSGSRFSELAVIFKNSFPHPPLYLVSELNGVNVFRYHMLGFIFGCFHALNTCFFIYKPFHHGFVGIKGVFGES